jgi:hypothetical protein
MSLLKRPSPALVISILALFVALGGTSYAITQLPKNSVGTTQLKKNAVTGAKVKDGSLSGADVDVATLGTVPAASSSNRANTAQTADRASSAGTADVAGTANSAATAGTARTADRAGTAGTADKAISADTAKAADKAATADSATNAASATNAQALGGMTAAQLIAASKLQCPPAMKLAAGVCIYEQPRAEATLYGAFQVCGEANFRLPTEGELIAFVNQYVDGSLTEWIEPEIVYENQFMGVLLTASKVEYSASTFNRATDQPYRCVTPASN